MRSLFCAPSRTCAAAFWTSCWRERDARLTPGLLCLTHSLWEVTSKVLSGRMRRTVCSRDLNHLHLWDQLRSFCLFRGDQLRCHPIIPQRCVTASWLPVGRRGAGCCGYKKFIHPCDWGSALSRKLISVPPKCLGYLRTSIIGSSKIHLHWHKKVKKKKVSGPLALFIYTRDLQLKFKEV